MIKLRRKKAEPAKLDVPPEETEPANLSLERRVGQRQFLKILGTAAGLGALASAGQLALLPQKAEAADETVTGNLMVTGSAAIGTSSAPWQRLTIVGGNVYVDNSAQWTPYIVLKGSYPNPAMGVGLALDSDAFYIKTGNSGAEAMRITVRRTGNVGIGLYSPAVALDVLGDIQASGNVKMNGAVAIGSDGVAKQTYYAS